MIDKLNIINEWIRMISLLIVSIVLNTILIEGPLAALFMYFIAPLDF